METTGEVMTILSFLGYQIYDDGRERERASKKEERRLACHHIHSAAASINNFDQWCFQQESRL